MKPYRSPAIQTLAARRPDLIAAAERKAADLAGAMLNGPRQHSDDAQRALHDIASGKPTAFEGIERTPPRGHEAIVRRIVRPPMMVRNGTFVKPAADKTLHEIMTIIDGIDRQKADAAIARVGRIEFRNVPGVPFVGTGWIVERLSGDKMIAVTNRHVAAEFAEADGAGGYAFKLLPNFSEFQVRLDFLEEHDVAGASEVIVARVRFIAGSGAPDIALIELEGEALRNLEPATLAARPAKAGDDIAVIGYPAFDSRNDAADVAAYFGDIFNVKRYAFGEVTAVTDGAPEFLHDASTLGGNSGSLVYDRASGDAVGLHFAGTYMTANYAVPVGEVKAALAGLKPKSVIASRVATEASGDGSSTAASFRRRDGYDRDFLAVRINPPEPKAWKADLSDILDADTGKSSTELKYRHFSVWMCSSRRLPLITAVNINGGKAKRVGRIDKWCIDERLDRALQIDNALYLGNALDRGHMVRREDPVWGPIAMARQANSDTFHYTNAAPQHEALNQRDWVNLEDYVLGNAKTRGLLVSVFTGPVFGEDDPDYRGIARLPKAFWKIVAIINDASGDPSVTAYLLSQGELIRGLTGEFVYGAFRTYQVEVAEIGRLTGLGVAHLAKHDPLGRRRRNEGLANTDTGRFVTIAGAADLVL